MPGMRRSGSSRVSRSDERGHSTWAGGPGSRSARCWRHAGLSAGVMPRSFGRAMPSCSSKASPDGRSCRFGCRGSAVGLRCSTRREPWRRDFASGRSRRPSETSWCGMPPAHKAVTGGPDWHPIVRPSCCGGGDRPHADRVHRRSAADIVSSLENLSCTHVPRGARGLPASMPWRASSRRRSSARRSRRSDRVRTYMGPADAKTPRVPRRGGPCWNS